MRQLDAADRAARVTGRAYRRLQWRAVWFLVPFGALIGVAVAAGFGLVWLAAETLGGWGVVFCGLVGAGLAFRDAWQSPEDFVGRWRL